ncbi:MAG: efflux transporter outer membrane subunit [Alloprevotella sp.]
MKKIVLFLFTVTAVWSLSGCGLYKTYEQSSARPELPSDSLSVDTLPELSWREMFTDTCLQALIAEALEHNADLRVAHLKTREAMASLRMAKKAFLPSADLNASGTVSGYDGSTLPKTYSAGVEVSWEADVFGRLTGAKREVAATVEEKAAYARAVRQQLIATVACQYYALSALDGKMAVTEATIESWRDYIATLEALAEAGQSDRPTISQARASLLSAEALLEQLKGQRIETESAIRQLLGRTDDGTSAHRRPLTCADLSSQSLCMAVERGVSLSALRSRPDVRRAEAALKQAYYRTQQAKADFYPRLTLSGNAGWTNSGGASVSNPGAILWQAVAALTQPLFRAGKLTSALAVRQAQQEAAAVEWQQCVLEAAEEVNNALTACRTADVRCRLLEEQIDCLQRVIEDTEAQMQYGEANALQIIVARQQLLAVELERIAEQYERLEAQTVLFRSVGGGATE